MLEVLNLNKIILLKDIFSLLNIWIVLKIMENRVERPKKWQLHVRLSICIGFSFLIRVVQNQISIHIAYAYFSMAVIIIALGKIIWNYSMKYSFIVSCIFLSFMALGTNFANTLVFIQTGAALFSLGEEYQVRVTVIGEIVVVVGMLMSVKIINRIPLRISRMSFLIIIVPNIINILIMILLNDQFYINTYMFMNMESVVTIIITGFVLMAGSTCNIAVLEHYLYVKQMENEKKLQIEMSLQYDYYKELEKDLEVLRKLSHDFKNHLETLSIYHEEEQKKEYIENIQKGLNQYESYYHTGNSFVDNILHRKKLDAIEQGTEFKVLADMKPFVNMKNEDLCIIVFNMLDNALRECALRKQEEPEMENIIQLRAGQFRSFLSIVCENSIRDSQVDRIESNEQIETTKEDKMHHGYGIKNIKSVTQKYGGELTFYVKDGLFCVSILIPI